MASGFAPEFLILLGVDIFLGASILTVLLDRHFPAPLPYVLEGASLIGFAELMAGPTFLNSFSQELQFYYSFAYAMISVLTLFATNLYLLFLRRRPFESAVLAICGTVPAGLGILYFTSAFVNGLTLSLPLVPVIPIEGVYVMFGLSIALVVFSLVFFGRRVKQEKAPEATEKKQEEQVVVRSASGPDEVLLMGREPETGPRPAPPAASGTPAAEPRSPGGAARAEGLEPQAQTRTDPGPTPEGPQRSTGDTPPGPRRTVQRGGTVLVEKPGEPTYAQRLVESMRFLEKAVDKPVKIDPGLLVGAIPNVKRAYLTSAGMIMAEDRDGRPSTLSLMDLSTDQALNIMSQVMRTLGGKGGEPK
jgi:hypothetical protein